MSMTPKDRFQYALGILIVLSFFMLLMTLALREVPSRNNDLLNLIIGALIAKFGTVVDYFFGTSASSAKKDETISGMVNKQQ